MGESAAFNIGAVIGIVLGLVIGGIVLSILWGTHRVALDKCARQHNVYACHMVAVPSEKENAR